MDKAERSTYTPLDFISWRESRSLVIAPKFQRRTVWTTPARSYLIDTLLRGMPVPPIYIRVVQSADKKRITREIIDGQQRISAVLDYIDGKYALSKTLNAPYSGKKMSDLDDDQQNAIRQYSFICEVFHGISDPEVLEIFARLNQYSVSLNAQELRNGRFFGHFKQSAYSLAYEHLEFWRRNRIFSERNIARMLEVELTSELIIAGLAGLQDKKKTINYFYEEYDKRYPEREKANSRFRATIDMIDDALQGKLAETQFRRPPLLYSLYCAVFHRAFGIPNLDLPSPHKPLITDERQSLLAAVTKLSDIIIAVREEEAIPSQYTKFVNACLRQTDNIQPRQVRLEGIYREAF